MAGEGRGGYRKPAHPASASGPGALSKRTDGTAQDVHQRLSAVPDQAYGDASQQQADQRIAPMGGSTAPSGQPQTHRGPQAAPPAPSAGPPAGVTAFNAPTQRPGEPITSGVATGAGPGPEALSFNAPMNQPTGFLTNMLAGMSASDTTGTLSQLYALAQQRGV